MVVASQQYLSQRAQVLAGASGVSITVGPVGGGAAIKPTLWNVDAAARPSLKVDDIDALMHLGLEHSGAQRTAVPGQQQLVAQAVEAAKAAALAARAAEVASVQAAAAVAALLSAAGGLPPTPSEFNVVSFGADRTGQIDSTAAIQAAVFAAMDNATDRTQSTVLFPSGLYRLSDTVNVSVLHASQSSGVTLRGVGVAKLQMDPAHDRDIFVGSGLWRFEASHLWLQNGRNQLNLGNHNANQGYFLIHDISFDNASGVAINTMNSNQTGHMGGTASTEVVVRECKFNNCTQVFINNCDWSTMEECWIEASCDTGARGVIENHDHLFLRDILGVPCNKQPAHAPSQTYWIGNHAYTHARNFRFGGEMGGFLALMNFAPYICEEIFGPKAPDGFQYEMCGLVNKSGAPLPPKMRTAPTSSVILESCAFSGR